MDILFARRDRSIIYKKTNAFGEKVEDFEHLPESKLTERQKNILFVEKRKYADYLKNRMEQEIKLRRHNIWLRHIELTYNECKESIGFAQKNRYIEDQIEFCQKYFSNINDLDSSQQDMNKIRRELIKFQRKMRNKQQDTLLTNPYDLLMNLT